MTTSPRTRLRPGRHLPADAGALSPDGKIYGEPFYGESSFLMYRKDVFAAKGLTVPENPTWDQVADLAAKVDGAQPGMKGICLRGQPGWGQMVRPADDRGEHLRWHLVRQGLERPGERASRSRMRRTSTSTGRAHGEVGASTGRLHRVPHRRWSRARWRCGTTRRPRPAAWTALDSPVAGKIGYVQAPVKLTKSSGWLYAWSWTIEKASQEPGRRLEVRLLGLVQAV